MRGAFKRVGFTFGSVVRCAGPGLVFWLMLLVPLSGFSAEGIFQGKVVNPPANEPVRPGWIFVQGGNRLLRRVEISKAIITFGQQVPSSQRRKCGPECLEPGQEIRVTAKQGSDGEWRARVVEILRLAAPMMQGQRTRSGCAQDSGSEVPPVTGPSAGDLTKLNTDLAGAAG
jgi:hypothetical protein